MEINFANVMAAHSDEELILMTTADRSKYQQTAIEAALKEIASRNIDSSRLAAIKQKIATDEKINALSHANHAGLGLRFANFLIDSMVIIAVHSLSGMLLISIFGRTNEDWLFLILFAAIYFNYYIALELVYHKTLGKMVTRTKVVAASGYELKMADIVGRTFCRLIPFDRLSFLVAKKGFHDSISQTMVVSD